MTDTKKNSALADPVPAKMTDAEILSIVKPFTEEADGGFACITGARQIVAAVRAIESRALSSAAPQEPVAWIVECQIAGNWVPQHPARPTEEMAGHDLAMFKTPFKRVSPLYTAPAQPQEQSESAYQRGYLDGMAKGRRDAQEQPVAAQQDDGYCRSCAGDKCTAGPECVTLGRDSTQAQAPQQEAGQARELPRSLLNLIGEYGMARSDGVSEAEILHRWQTLIAGIKEYARAAICASRKESK